MYLVRQACVNIDGKANVYMMYNLQYIIIYIIDLLLIIRAELLINDPI